MVSWSSSFNRNYHLDHCTEPKERIMSRSIFSKNILNGILTICLAAAMTACGSGGGGGGGTKTPTPVTLTGTAAAGTALSNATITIYSADGASRTIQTRADGGFSADLTGTNGPYLLQTGTGDQTLTSWAPAGNGV